MNVMTINWESLGAAFANEDADAQALFFKGMACELNVWSSAHESEMQFACVSKALHQDHGTLEQCRLKGALRMITEE